MSVPDFAFGVSPNEYCNMYSVNRNISALVAKDEYLARLAASTGVPSYSENAVYDVDDYVWYKTSKRAMNVYLLKSLVSENVEPPKIVDEDGYLYVVSSKYWEVVNSDNNIDGVNIVDIANIYRAESAAQLHETHELNVSTHKFGVFNAENSNILRSDLTNMSPTRRRMLGPELAYCGNGLIMRKWPNGILEYDISCTLEKKQVDITMRGNNGYYYVNQNALSIPDGRVVAGRLDFPEPFVDLNYMVYGSRQYQAESAAARALASAGVVNNAVRTLAANRQYTAGLVDFDEYGLAGVGHTVSWHDDQIPQDGIVRIPSEVDVIAAYAFENFGVSERRLSVIPEDLENSKLEDINDFAFCGSGITYLMIPKTVRRIGQDVFHGCFNLKLVDVYVDTTSSDVQLDFGKGAFRACGSDVQIVIHENDFPNPYDSDALYSRLTADPEYYGLASSANVTRVNDFDQSDPTKHRMQTFTVDQLLGRGAEAQTEEKRDDVPVKPKRNRYRIKDHAYSEDEMTEFQIDGHISAIGDYSFEYCYQLSDITNCGIPDILSGIQGIGEYAFYDCSAMTELSLIGIQKIGENAFLGTRLSCLCISSDQPLSCIIDTDVGIGLDTDQIIKYTNLNDRHAGGFFSGAGIQAMPLAAASPDRAFRGSVMVFDKTLYGITVAAKYDSSANEPEPYMCHIVGRWK